MNNDIFDSKKFKLENGLEIISIKKNTELFSLHVGVKIGSIYEEVQEKGISHFIEHMLFKGTKTMSNEKLNEAFESLGGEYNAYTDYDCTVYSITALKEEMDLGLKLISDMIRNAVFDEEEFQKEKEVILAEIRSIKDDIEDYSFAKVHEIGFSKGPLKYDTIGSETNIKRFSNKDLINFYNKYYAPNNSCLVLVSSLDHEEVFLKIKKCFEDWNEKIIVKKQIVTEKNLPLKKFSYKNDLEQSTITYMFTFYNLTRIEEMAVKILNYKFGESANSILFREIRENKGLAYDVYSEINTAECAKTMYIYTSVKKKNVNLAIDCIDNCIKNLKNKKNFLDNNSIILMKKVLKTAVISTIEDTTDLGNYVIHQCIDGKNIYEFLEDIKNVDIIKVEDIITIAKKVLNDPTIHIMIPKESD